MPAFNGTGPAGLGPRTGWGRGRCPPSEQETSAANATITGDTAPGAPSPVSAPVFGAGRGGVPWGCGRGFCHGGRGRGVGNARQLR